ncbi:MAG: hypothetical protein LBD37_02320 [Treponema sp.]|nr:hypothetical protein [Treponema sp.]
MNKKWKAALTATAVLLLTGTPAFAQASGSSRRGEGRKIPFALDDRANCGPGRSSGCGGFSGGAFDDGGGNGNSNGNGGGFNCH